MDRIKCATFNQEMQNNIPQEIREKMDANRAKAEKEQEIKNKNTSRNTLDEYRKCANCGKIMNMTKKEYITIMDRGMHRYVCSSKCMIQYYHH